MGSIRFIPKETVTLKLESVDGTERNWVNIALEGRYLGYLGGERPFEFTPETFDQIVANFRANPSYKADDAGVGTEPVISWDFAHASEMDPSSGRLPSAGAPAQGWIFELERRTNDDGKAELWALTEFLEPAATYVKEKKYRWASVAVHFNCVDSKTAEPIGAVLSSVALTNGPFIEGLVPLAAARGFWFEAAEDPKEALRMFKELFGLPELSEVAAVTSELAKLSQWIETGTTPMGIDVSGLIGPMRKILNLPAMSSEGEVLSEATKVVTRLLEEQVIDNGGAPSPVVEPQLSNPSNGGQDMELLAKLAKLLGVKDTEHEVISAIEDAVELRHKLKEIHATRRGTNAVILEAATEAKADAADVKGKLATILKAIGVEDTDAAVATVADLLTKADQLTKAMPELEQLREKVGVIEDAQIEADVADAMAAHKLPDNVKDALLLFRKGQPGKFAETYPKVSPDKVALTRPMATDRGDPLPVVNLTKAKDDDGPKGDQIDIGPYDGRNTTERAMAYIKATRADAGSMSWDQLYHAGRALKRQPNVIDSRAQ